MKIDIIVYFLSLCLSVGLAGVISIDLVEDSYADLSMPVYFGDPT